MADPKAAPFAGGVSRDLQEVEQALADDQREAERKHLDETVEGGKYKVGDQFVDAEGVPVKDAKKDEK